MIEAGKLNATRQHSSDRGRFLAASVYRRFHFCEQMMKLHPAMPGFGPVL